MLKVSPARPVLKAPMVLWELRLLASARFDLFSECEGEHKFCPC